MAEEERKLKEAAEKWLGRLILLKYVGYAVLGLSIGLIILLSVLQIIFLQGLLTNTLLIGILLIAIGLIGERLLSQ